MLPALREFSRNYVVFSAGLAWLLLIPAILKRVQTEEAEMLHAFGAAYEDYRSKTWRFIPFVF